MRRAVRGFFWLIAFAMAGGLAWWGWSLGPRPRFVVDGFDAHVNSGTFSADSRWLAVARAGMPGMMRVLDAQTGQELFDRSDLDWMIVQRRNAVDLTYADLMATGIDAAPTPFVGPMPATPGPGNDRVFRDATADFRTLAFDREGGGDATIFVNGARRALILPPDFQLLKYTANDDVFLISSTTSYGKHVVWDFRRKTACFNGIEFNYFLLSSDRKSLAAWSGPLHELDKCHIHLCDLVQFTEAVVSLEPRQSHTHNLMTFSPDERFLVVDSASMSGEIIVIDLQNTDRRSTMTLGASAECPTVVFPRFSNDGTRLFTTHHWRQLACWQFNDGQPVLRYTVGSAGIFAADGTPIETFAEQVRDAVVIGGSSPLTERNPLSARKLGAGAEHRMISPARLLPYASYRVSRDGRWAVVHAQYVYVQSRFAQWMDTVSPLIASWLTPSHDEALVIDLEAGHRVATLPIEKVTRHGDLGDFIGAEPHFSPDGLSLAIIRADGRLFVYDLPPRRRVLVPAAMTLPLLGLAWLFWRQRRAGVTAARGQ